MLNIVAMKYVFLLMAFLVVGYAFAQAPSPAALEGLSAREALEVANPWKGLEVVSFATPKAIHFVFPGRREVVIPMQASEMMVSVAPYVTRTHPCATHYMSGCQGELVGVPVRVLATAADGEVLINETMTTPANGFLDLWLPRNKTIALRMSVGGHSTSGEITTFDDSWTCITTLQLTVAN